MSETAETMVRGDLRVIYADAGCIACPSMQSDMGDQVWAVVGPIGNHTSHPELQDALEMVGMAFNRRHGRLSEKKHGELLRDRSAESMADGVQLLREALAAWDDR